MASTGEVARERRPELDGLRGIAIALVLTLHLGFTPWAPSSGAVGVAVFFTLSGYLITGILLGDHQHYGRVQLGRFFENRARRLLPAMLALVAATILIGNLDWWAALATVTYWTNWLQADGTHLYHGLSHTWSLAIEEQFYLLWPLVIIALRGRRRAVVALAVLGSLAAITLRLMLWDDGAGFWRGYFGTDTRADGLLIGCALAAVLGTRRVSPLWLAPALGVIGYSATVSSSGAFVILWTPLVVSVATAVCIACRPTWAITVAPLRWLGQRAYGMYLWHAFVLGFGLSSALLSLAISLVATEVSWRLIEQPFRRRPPEGSGDPVGSDAAAPYTSVPVRATPAVDDTRINTST
jgi:peptidoglycan/LPS O-acetylase OafA/YrhL